MAGLEPLKVLISILRGSLALIDLRARFSIEAKEIYSSTPNLCVEVVGEMPLANLFSLAGLLAVNVSFYGIN